jgi:hypothetical protein
MSIDITDWDSNNNPTKGTTNPGNNKVITLPDCNGVMIPDPGGSGPLWFPAEWGIGFFNTVGPFTLEWQRTGLGRGIIYSQLVAGRFRDSGDHSRGSRLHDLFIYAGRPSGDGVAWTLSAVGGRSLSGAG